MPAHNEGARLADTIDSIASGRTTDARVEIVIADDKSDRRHRGAPARGVAGPVPARPAGRPPQPASRPARRPASPQPRCPPRHRRRPVHHRRPCPVPVRLGRHRATSTCVPTGSWLAPVTQANTLLRRLRLPAGGSLHGHLLEQGTGRQPSRGTDRSLPGDGAVAGPVPPARRLRRRDDHVRRGRARVQPAGVAVRRRGDPGPATARRAPVQAAAGAGGVRPRASGSTWCATACGSACCTQTRMARFSCCAITR